MSASFDRRRFLLAGGALVVGACSSSGEGSASGSPPSSTVTSSSASAGAVASTSVPAASASTSELVPADFEALPTCGLVPTSAAGPFGLDQQFERRDITEGIVGHPLLLGLRVVDGACVPLTGVAVEVWHSDPTGDYSAFADGGTGKDDAEGSTFLRGTQPVRDDGIVSFSTLYPGWYPGRTPHIHVRVQRDGSAVYTGQLYFDDGYTAQVYGDEPYAPNGQPDTTNDADVLAGSTLPAGLLELRPINIGSGPGTQALLNLGIEV